ncbi:O-acetyl-ADP-ribose deacetylase [Celerinatantimonas yamalensis]|uniref:O-acetyl-ADP-ribose deacetylase n=1 Tax=Celerinatantimonas yamalensis TaxID=559956 RepID=A0ABW9G2R7_9GAMM
MSHIQLIQGDITTAHVDAIVNAANSRMLGGGGVDGAIHRVAGPELLQACLQVPESEPGVRCPVGHAQITRAGRLSAKFVIHTVGPIYRSHHHSGPYLESAYRHTLELARTHHCHSIAFPAISCGVYGYPYQDAAQIALTTCLDYGELDITFYLFADDIYQVWQDVYQQLLA